KAGAVLIVETDLVKMPLSVRVRLSQKYNVLVRALNRLLELILRQRELLRTGGLQILIGLNLGGLERPLAREVFDSKRPRVRAPLGVRYGEDAARRPLHR